MKTLNQYFFEYLLLVITLVLSVAGFWNIYFGAGANPNPYHHLHAVTDFTWLFLLLYQLNLIRNKKFRNHRKLGLSVLVIGPLLFATTSLLSVHSANKGLVSGQGDMLIVQNVMVTLELGLVILMAFILRKRRTLHGSFILSSAILMMGIALFFTFISFVPGFKIAGPETFDRFQKSAITAQIISMIVGILFFIKDRKGGWPFMLVGSFFLLNELIRSYLTAHNLIQPLTEFVGTLSEPVTFVGSFGFLLVLLAATGVQNTKQKPRTDGVPVVSARTD